MTVTANRGQDIEALLPFYVNGTLDESERKRVEERLAEDSDLRSQVVALRRIRAQMREMDLGATPGAFGLARLERDIARMEAQRRPLRARSLSLLAASLAGLLAFGIAWFSTESDAPYIQASGGDIAGTLTVAFRPDATEAAIADLLLENGLVIVDGPSAIGLYRVNPGENRDLEALATSLRARPDVIESVGLP